jgi:hypothetical protein
MEIVWFGGSRRGIERLRDGMFTSYTTAQGLPADGNGPIYVDSEMRTWFAPLSPGDSIGSRTGESSR